MLDKILNKIRPYIPTKLFKFLQPPYHYSLALLAALIYRFPSRKIKVIGVTGTKGKSTTTEIINALLEEAGYTTALSNTIRYKIGENSVDNKFKMSMPGRFFVQRLIRKAVSSKCDYIILEMTSQGTLQFRHKFIHLDAFVFTNLSPEHIDSHGSYEKYVAAKVKIADEMMKSKKANRIIIANADDKESVRFLACPSEVKATFSTKDAEPFEIKKEGIDFTLGAKTVHSPLSGLFNLYNLLAAIACIRNFGVSDDVMVRAIEKFEGVKGRVEKIKAGQDFNVVVDYAHTPDSLEKLYQVFNSSRNICVLGGTGGGRDNWKRKEMGRIADMYCDEVILTDEDPYDEDPNQIVKDVAEGVTGKTPKIIMDRRAAIAEAIKSAKTGDSVLITGKGTDPYIMGPNGTKTPWSDARIAKEELEKITSTAQNSAH
ncbi:MAG: UDP-N-acetylmuramoyl-L-alanyl-D-glutamate--2,6-diaminopimelate ligase [Patescibacteria group bacterium]|nr:UDP-N-acetylmuramoyl-L-alanyl-D-glutamate--2,6-diaminopimelate ligase [Patescibacteria group bacterium]